MGEFSPDLQKQVDRAIVILRYGGLVAYPTDTVYGLGANMSIPSAVERIFAVKERPRGMALPLLVANRAQIEELVGMMPPSADHLISTFMPGALTIVLPKTQKVSDIITGGNKTIALRIPSHPVPLALISGLGVPIVGTSANLSGQPSPLTAAEVKTQIGDKIEMVIDGGRCPGGIESTVVDLTGDKPVILRQGAITLGQLRSVCPDIMLAKEIKDATRHR